MCERGHACIASLDDLARQLGHPLDDLHSIAARASRYYRRILLPRSNGSHRRIDSPRDPIRSMQRWILRHVLTSYRPHDSVHGFVRGRSIVTNAALHVGHATVVTVDLADFFPGIRYQQVRKGFEKLGYPYSVARLLASLCTKDGALPQGAPTSPALSNLVCERLDRRLSGLARARGFQYTRYADDMSFSSDHKRLPTILPVVAQIIGEEGFTIRTEKTRVARKGARRSVTGVVVNERLNLPRAHVRRLRAAAHYYVHKGDRAIVLGSRTRPDSDPRAVLAGHLAFLSMVNALRGNALRRIVSSA